MKKSKDVIVIGLALFAMFFGAGNLIFPPKLGAELGHSWMTGVLGFSLSDAGISFLAVVAIALSGGKIDSLGEKVHPGFGKLLSIVAGLILGPLIAVSRTGAVAYEMGIRPLFPEMGLFIFTIIYFGAAYVILMDQKNVLDKIGKILTPLLLIGLAVIVVRGILYPASAPVEPNVHERFGAAFLEGYQTIDGLGALLLTGFVIASLKQKGYTQKKTILKMTIMSAILASILVTIIYASLMYLGATNAPAFAADISRSDLFISIVDQLMGPAGKVFMALTVTMACFTTAVGLTATIGKIFEKSLKNRFSYKWIVGAMLVSNLAFSNLGVELIIKAAEPVLKIIYPIVVVLVILRLTERFFQSKSAWRMAIATCVFINIPGFCIITGIHFPYATPETYGFPMVNWQIEWLLPSLVVAAITEGIVRFSRNYILSCRLNSQRIK